MEMDIALVYLMHLALVEGLAVKTVSLSFKFQGPFPALGIIHELLIFLLEHVML